jgi:hypothetical protein
MRISSCLPARQLTELLRYRNAEPGTLLPGDAYFCVETPKQWKDVAKQPMYASALNEDLIQPRKR